MQLCYRIHPSSRSSMDPNPSEVPIPFTGSLVTYIPFLMSLAW